MDASDRKLHAEQDHCNGRFCYAAASVYKSTQNPVFPFPLVNTSAFGLSSSDGSFHISAVNAIVRCARLSYALHECGQFRSRQICTAALLRMVLNEILGGPWQSQHRDQNAVAAQTRESSSVFSRLPLLRLL